MICGKGAVAGAVVILLFFLPTVRGVLAEPITAPPHVIRLATVAPEGSVWLRFFRKAFDEVAEKTNGTVRFEIIAGGTMGDEPEYVEKMEKGELDAAVGTTNIMHKLDPALSVLSLPFVFESDAEYLQVKDRLLEYFQGRMLRKGYHLLAIALRGGGSHLWSSEVRKTLPDLVASETFFQWAGEPSVKAWQESIGVQRAVPLALPDLLGALRDGRVTVVRTDPLTLVVVGWFQFIRTVYMLDITYQPVVIVMTRKAWENLPANSRDIVDAEIAAVIPSLTKRTLYEEEIAMLGMSKRRVEIVHPPAEEIAWLKERSMATWKKLEGKMFPPELLKRVIEIRDEYRAQNRQNR